MVDRSIAGRGVGIGEQSVEVEEDSNKEVMLKKRAVVIRKRMFGNSKEVVIRNRMFGNSKEVIIIRKRMFGNSKKAIR